MSKREEIMKYKKNLEKEFILLQEEEEKMKKENLDIEEIIQLKNEYIGSIRTAKYIEKFFIPIEKEIDIIETLLEKCIDLINENKKLKEEYKC